jgi:hypothetical protein
MLSEDVELCILSIFLEPGKIQKFIHYHLKNTICCDEPQLTFNPGCPFRRQEEHRWSNLDGLSG